MVRKDRAERVLSSILKLFSVLLLGIHILPHQAQFANASGGEIEVPGGAYLPFFLPPTPLRFGKDQIQTPTTPTARKPVGVGKFKIDVYPVTNQDFLRFVKSHPEWRRSRIPRVFADQRYLAHWKTDLALLTSADMSRPVTNVSWYAATAFCQSKGKELPTTDQWEYVGMDAGRNSESLNAEILRWYGISASKPLRLVTESTKNGYGVYGLFGLIWEWTLDFNNLMTSGESRNSGTKDEGLFCGSGGLGSLDASDYAKFMRYSFRSSLKADYTTSQLGFRCAQGEK